MSLGPFFRSVCLLPLVSRHPVISLFRCRSVCSGARFLAVLWWYPFPTREQLLTALGLGACLVLVVAVAVVVVVLALRRRCTIDKT